MMESIRQRATNRAKERKDNLNRVLVEVIRSDWPTVLSPVELKLHLKSIPYYNPVTFKPRNVKSLFNRLVRRNIIKFNSKQKIWINLTHIDDTDTNLQN